MSDEAPTDFGRGYEEALSDVQEWLSSRNSEQYALKIVTTEQMLALVRIEHDFDLRSRCLLIPTHQTVLELLARDGSEPLAFEVETAAASSLLAESAQACADYGLAWPTEPIRLEPTPKLVELIKRSRSQLREQPADADVNEGV